MGQSRYPPILWLFTQKTKDFCVVYQMIPDEWILSSQCEALYQMKSETSMLLLNSTQNLFVNAA
jgi:hypothetical protein